MTTFSINDAQKDLDRVLDEATRSGGVEIRRLNGQAFVVQPSRQTPTGSGLDVPGVKANVTTQEIVSIVREGREGRCH